MFNLHWDGFVWIACIMCPSPEGLCCHFYYCPAEGEEESTGMAHKAEHAD